MTPAATSPLIHIPPQPTLPIKPPIYTQPHLRHDPGCHQPPLHRQRQKRLHAGRVMLGVRPGRLRQGGGGANLIWRWGVRDVRVICVNAGMRM